MSSIAKARIICGSATILPVISIIRCGLITVQFAKHAPSFGGGSPVNEDGLDELAYEEDDDDLS